MSPLLLLLIALMVAITLTMRFRGARLITGPGAPLRIVVITIASLAIPAVIVVLAGTRKGLPGFERFGVILGGVTEGAMTLLRMGRILALAERPVSHRLFALLAFATIVPSLVLLTLWAATSWLGASSDRAQAAVRGLRSEERRLEADLTLALARPADAESRLSDLALMRARSGERVIAWLRRGSWARVAGEIAWGDTAFREWPADSPGRATLAVIGGVAYVGARAVAASDTALAAIGLIPVRGPMADDISRRIGARVRTTDGSARRISYTATGALDEIGDGGLSPTAGYAEQLGWIWDGTRWQRSGNILSVETDLAVALGGLVRNPMVTPIAVIPLVLLLLLVLVAARVLVMTINTARTLGVSISAAAAALRTGAGALEAGRLDHRIVVAGDNDLWDVAAAFNRMAEGLERGRELERERQRLESELAVARRIQSRLLPERAPEVRGAEIAGFSEPAREVGGDYYDHIVLADGRVALVIADVSGKGMPAALLMSAFRAALLTQLDGGAEPGAAFGHVNRFLHRSIEPGRFVTAFLAVLDPQSERIDYCNAGHNPPYLVTRDGRTTTLETGGLLLGMLEDSSYAQGVAELAPGNMLVLFTDGVTEAQRADGAMWGEERLVSTLREGACEPCAALVRRIVDAVRAFEGGERPSDDITLLIARRTAT